MLNGRLLGIRDESIVLGRRWRDLAVAAGGYRLGETGFGAVTLFVGKVER